MTRAKKWFKLDNAAKLYPAVATSRWSSTFRMSAEFTSPVDPHVLQQAAERVLPRFPSLKVRMRKGVFWYYLEEIREPIIVREDAGHPCMPFRSKQDHGYLLRIFYYQNRISTEFFHALTDGTGGLVFLKTLTAEYLRLRGKRVAYDHGALNPREPVSREETQDAFRKMPLPSVRVSRKETPAYHFPATREIPHTLHLIAASMPCDQIKALARAQGATITEYLTAAMLYVAYRFQKTQELRRLLPLRVSVPVNMRAFYPTKTLRNFSSFINPSIDPRLGDYSFEEIVRETKAFMRYNLNPKFLCATIATNVADEKNLLMRLVPLFVKNMAIGFVFRRAGDRLVTATISNLGKTEKPTGTEKLIRRFEFQLGAPPKALCNCAAVTNENEMRLVFSSNIQETTLPRELLCFLVEQGVQVEVESNRKGDE